MLNQNMLMRWHRDLPLNYPIPEKRRLDLIHKSQPVRLPSFTIQKGESGDFFRQCLRETKSNYCITNSLRNTIEGFKNDIYLDIFYGFARYEKLPAKEVGIIIHACNIVDNELFDSTALKGGFAENITSYYGIRIECISILNHLELYGSAKPFVALEAAAGISS